MLLLLLSPPMLLLCACLCEREMRERAVVADDVSAALWRVCVCMRLCVRESEGVCVRKREGERY